MDPNGHSVPSLLSHNPTLIGIARNDLASQLQAGFFDNIQSNGTEESLITPRSSSFSSQLYDHYHGSEYQSIPPSVPSMSNRQLPFYEVEVLVGLSLSHGQFPDLPFLTDPNDANTLHAASTRFYPAGWRGANQQMEQAVVENRNPLSPRQDMYGASRVSAPPEPSSNSGTISSVFAKSYTQSKVQDDNADATSFPHGQVESTTLSPVATRGQNATAQEASQQREQKAEKKRERDRTRKKTERSSNKQDYAKICKLLEIPVKPDNTLAHHILVVVEGLVEQHEVDGDLRNQLKKTEAYARFLKSKLTNLPAGDDIGTSLHYNTLTALDDLDTDATLCS